MDEMRQIDAAATRIMKSGISTDSAKYAELLAAEAAAGKSNELGNPAPQSGPAVNGSATKEASDTTRPEQKVEPFRLQSYPPIPTTPDEARLIQLLQNQPVAALDQSPEGIIIAFGKLAAEITELQHKVGKAQKKMPCRCGNLPCNFQGLGTDGGRKGWRPKMANSAIISMR